MRRNLFGWAAAGMLALASTAVAQDPPRTQEPRKPAPGQEAQAEPQQKVTVEGCLMREADVPGREPNVAERAGLGEDYILTSAKLIKGSAPSSVARPQAGEKPGQAPTGTAGTQPMFQVEGIDDEKLKAHVGQRVQIDGTFENVDRAKTADDLVELRGTMIRKAAGECPAK